jgi:hypothetical protein
MNILRRGPAVQDWLSLDDFLTTAMFSVPTLQQPHELWTRTALVDGDHPMVTVYS